MTVRKPSAILQRSLPRPGMNAVEAGTLRSKDDPVTVEYVTRLIANLQQILDELTNPGTSRCANLVIHQCQESGSNLNVGDVYVDGNGFLKLRQSGIPVLDSLSATGTVSSVTVTII